ncbi:hypothetical protein ACFE04_013240 [Oxalis oulophora]
MADENPDSPQRVRSYNLPNFLFSVKLKYVKLGYHYLVTNAMYLFLVPIICTILVHLSTIPPHDFNHVWNHLRFNLLTVVLCSASIVFAATLYFMSSPRKVYLLDFSCYKPDADSMVTKEIFMQLSVKSGNFREESLQFQRKLLERSGLGQKTYGPVGLLNDYRNQTMAEARKETETIIFGAVDKLLASTNISPRDIGILVVNSSLFNPTPSLSASIVNHYKLRGNIVTYNLGGMGCSAGIISIDLAKDLLQVHRNTYALVVSTENMTYNWYTGNDRSMLVTNTLFRMGGAAILLSNKWTDRGRSKYELVHTLRTHKGADDKSFGCVQQKEDENRKVGVSLSKDLMAVAGEALKTNITTLGPLVLPMSEQLLFLATLIGRKVLKMKIKPYIPDFKLAFEHFCIHAGGRAEVNPWLYEIDDFPVHVPSNMPISI